MQRRLAMVIGTLFCAAGGLVTESRAASEGGCSVSVQLCCEGQQLETWVNSRGSQTVLLCTGKSYAFQACCSCTHNVTLTSNFGCSDGPHTNAFFSKTFSAMGSCENDHWVKATCQQSGTSCLVEFTVVDVFFNPWEQRVPPTKPGGTQGCFSYCLTLSGGRQVGLSWQRTSGTAGSVTDLNPNGMTYTPTSIAFTGDQQTWVSDTGGCKNVQLRATASYGIAAAVSDFSVCAHPCNFSAARIGDENGAGVGVSTSISWVSDSGSTGHLDQAEWGERVLEHQRDNPPFTTAFPEVFPTYRGARFPPWGDIHTYPRADTSKAGLQKGTTYHATAKQQYQFRCIRCGLQNQPCVASGYHIVHEVKWSALWDQWLHKCTKTGQPVEIDYGYTGAGGGSAVSDEHQIGN